MRNRQIHAVRISIADPKHIEKWGKEVTRPETINYRTGLPEPEGLFCEKIFGPTKNFECYCGKYKNVRREGLVCDVCGVTVTHSRVRRRWMGTIRLAAPVVHPWFLNIQPGVIQTILALTKRALKQIVYYMKYAVTFVDAAKKERLLQRRPDAPEFGERLQELEELSRDDLLERLSHYVGPLRDWAESEIQLHLSRSSRPDYHRTVKPREYLFSIAGRQEVLSPVVDEVTGEVLMEVRDQLDYRNINRLVESGVDLRKLMVKVGKTGRTLEKSISQRLTQEEIVQDATAGDGHVVAAAGTTLRDVFWDLLPGNSPVVLASLRDREQYEDIQGRVVREIAQIIDGLDAFHRLEGYVALDGGSSTDGFIVSGAEKRNLDRVSKIIEKRGDLASRDVFRVATGGNAIHELLRSFEIRPVVEGLEAKVAKVPKTQQRPIQTRLQVLKGFLRSGQYGMDRANRLEWMVLRTLPVIPPDLRPIVSLEGGRQATSDINELYHRVITRNNRLRHMEKILAPEVIINNEKRLLQQSVDALIDNSRRERPDVDPNGRPFESLSDTLRGKKGRFRQNLLGKRVDYSARAVIVAGPRLKLWQCGLPKTIGLELFKPKLIHLLQEEGLAEHVMDAIALIDDLYRQDERTRRRVWDLLSGLVSTSVIMLNRAPTLHRLGIQAFEPTLTDEHAIRLHPLVCTPFNADFDGDQMAVHLPLSEGAQAEARLLVMSSNNLYVPGTGVPAHLPSQDIVLGLAYMTSDPSPQVTIKRTHSRSAAKLAAGMVGHVVTENVTDAGGKVVVAKWTPVDAGVVKALAAAAPAGKGWDVPISEVRATYLSPQDVEDTYYSGVAAPDGKRPLSVRDVIGVREQNGSGYRVRFTTVGRSIFNSILPAGHRFVDDMVQKRELLRLIHEVLATCPQRETVAFLDDVKRLGFRQCTLAGISLSVSDIVIPEKKAGVVSRAERLEGRVDRAFEAGMIDGKFAGHLNQRLGANLLFPSKNPKTGEEVLVRPNELGRPAKREWNEVDERWSDGKCPLFGHVLEPATFTRPMYEEVIESLWDRATSKITDLLVEAAAVDNPLMLMVNSGARGAMDQIRQLAGLRGLMRDPAGKLILVPIKSNFKEGLSVHEYFSSTHGARKGQTDTALRTSRSGYLTRRLVDIAQGVYAAGDDCNTMRSIGKRPFDGPEGGWEWESFPRRLVGRTVAEVVTDADGPIAPARTVLDMAAALRIRAEVRRRCEEAEAAGETKVDLRRRGLDEVRVHSPITCEQPDGVCRVCYGLSVASRSPAEYGDPVGVMAAQSIGEPGTQLTMRTFHTGGAAGADVADITQGLPLAEIFFECYQSRFETRADSEGAVLASVSGSIRAIVPGKAEDKHIAEIKIFQGPKSKDITKVKIAPGRRVLVRVGDSVVAGEALTTGLRSPSVLLAMQGRDAVQRYVIDTIQGVYRSQGVEISDVHFEVILREMMRYVRVVNPGDSYMQAGQELPAAEVNAVNRQLERHGRDPVLWEPIIVGLKRGAVMSPSFLSAASFQQTAKALLNAAIQGKVDFLQGLKENVIVGERIPVGTGYRPLLDVAYDVEGPPMGAGLEPEATPAD